MSLAFIIYSRVVTQGPPLCHLKEENTKLFSQFRVFSSEGRGYDTTALGLYDLNILNAFCYIRTSTYTIFKVNKQGLIIFN